LRGQWYDLKIGNISIKDAGWKFKPESPGFIEEAENLIVFDFTKLDKWLEDEEVVVGHPRSPYSRIDARRSSRHVQVFLDNVLLAETRNATFLYENGHPTRYYIDAIDVKGLQLFSASTYQSACAYKGVASYFNVTIEGKEHANIVWTYLNPDEALTKIQGKWSFWNESVDIFVDGEAIPRPARYIVHTSP